MKFEPDLVKGFQDFLPPESLKRRKLKEIVETKFKLNGFLPIETPFIEFDELMKPDTLPNENEDEAISDRFRLKDKGARNLGLRYELTFQLGRILRLNPNIKLPFRRYQIGEVFRDEPISSGRFRQFTQCDIDIVGDSSINAELQCLSCFKEISEELNIKNLEFQVNNRKLLGSIIDSVEIGQKSNVMRELDKLEKIGIDTVKINLKKYADVGQIVTLFKLLEKPFDFFLENQFEGAEELNDLMKNAKLFGLKLIFNPLMIRGLSYYTGNIFEIVKKGEKTIAAGGRYDKSVGKFLNKEIPAVGLSFSLERLSMVSELKEEPFVKVLVISLNEDKEAIKLTKLLKEKNISCFVWFSKVGKGMEFADSYKIPYVIFLGEEEVSKKKFKIKNMTSGVEKSLNEKQLIKEIL
jgi:histidyl-tRNA synthetase